LTGLEEERTVASPLTPTEGGVSADFGARSLVLDSRSARCYPPGARAARVKELLPVTLGVIVAGGAAAVRSLRRRALLLPVGAILAGACASAINGELASERWMLFVTFDSLLVWLSAFVTCGLVQALRRRRRRPGRAIRARAPSG
jgi:hypothetical protein